jgi:hypothetical protein
MIFYKLNDIEIAFFAGVNMSKFTQCHILALVCCGAIFFANTDAVAQTEPEISKGYPVSETPKAASFVDERGFFLQRFKTFADVIDKSHGNSTNQLLLKEIELIYLNSRCEVGVTRVYSMMLPSWAQIDETIARYKEFLKANPGIKISDPERKKQERLLVDEVLSIVTKKWFPRKAKCDALPIALSKGNAFPDLIFLEIDNAQNPLVGTKYNDGLIFSGANDGDPYSVALKAELNDPNFADKYSSNGFDTLPNALNAARFAGSGNKLIIYDGAKIALYRMGSFKVDSTKSGAEFDAQFDVFKSAKLPKGWSILAAALGRDKVVTINKAPKGNAKSKK